MDDLISRQAAIDILTKTSGIRGDALKALYDLPSVTLQEPCKDAISRETVLKIIDGWYEQNRDTDNIEDLIVLITYMDSVNPQKPNINEVLAKIRAEIADARFIDKDTKHCKNANATGLEVAMNIIDKFMAEGSDKE